MEARKAVNLILLGFVVISFFFHTEKMIFGSPATAVNFLVTAGVILFWFAFLLLNRNKNALRYVVIISVIAFISSLLVFSAVSFESFNFDWAIPLSFVLIPFYGLDWLFNDFRYTGLAIVVICGVWLVSYMISQRVKNQ